MGGNQTLIKTDISCLMIEKTPIVRQVGQIAKYAPLWAAHTISQMRQCRGAASSMSPIDHARQSRVRACSKTRFDASGPIPAIGHAVDRCGAASPKGA
jgi:hypothetical protein